MTRNTILCTNTTTRRLVSKSNCVCHPATQPRERRGAIRWEKSHQSHVRNISKAYDSDFCGAIIFQIYHPFVLASYEHADNFNEKYNIRNMRALDMIIRPVIRHMTIFCSLCPIFLTGPSLIISEKLRKYGTRNTITVDIFSMSIGHYPHISRDFDNVAKHPS